jgi:site-specific recombinase XerD
MTSTTTQPQVDPYLDILRADLGNRYSPDTVRTYINQNRAFLEYAGIKPQYTRQEILSYVDHLIGQGKSKTSIQTATSSIRALFVALEIPWPLTKRDMRLNLPDSEEAPTLSPEDVERLIAGVKARKAKTLQAVVVLSTVYGLRVIEISRVLAAGCDGQELVVPTAKGGRRRIHTIPQDLAQYLTFPPTKVGRAKLQTTFDELMTLYVRAKRPGEGWHAVRSAVDTALFRAGLSRETIERWMGWRRTGMAARYNRPEAELLDEQVYAVHPFLVYWR